MLDVGSPRVHTASSSPLLNLEFMGYLLYVNYEYHVNRHFRLLFHGLIKLSKVILNHITMSWGLIAQCIPQRAFPYHRVTEMSPRSILSIMYQKVRQLCSASVIEGR